MSKLSRSVIFVEMIEAYVDTTGRCQVANGAVLDKVIFLKTSNLFVRKCQIQ